MEKHKTYVIGSYASNAMRSGNPNSGIYETKTSRCLDLNGGDPACNQGGVIILHRMGYAKPEDKENEANADT